LYSLDAAQRVVAIISQPQQQEYDRAKGISLATTAEGTRRVMNIRYSLLPYTYTLFYKANSAGETVLRALAWEFPNDPSLKLWRHSS